MTPSSARSDRRVLEHHRDALPRADADAKHPVAKAALVQLSGEGEDVARAGGPEGVPDRDRAAVGVEPVVRHLEAAELVGELAQDGDGDRGVGLVDLPDVDLLRLEAG